MRPASLAHVIWLQWSVENPAFEAVQQPSRPCVRQMFYHWATGLCVIREAFSIGIPGYHFVEFFPCNSFKFIQFAHFLLLFFKNLTDLTNPAVPTEYVGKYLVSLLIKKRLHAISGNISLFFFLYKIVLDDAKRQKAVASSSSDESSDSEEKKSSYPRPKSPDLFVNSNILDIKGYAYYWEFSIFVNIYVICAFEFVFFVDSFWILKSETLKRPGMSYLSII